MNSPTIMHKRHTTIYYSLLLSCLLVGTYQAAKLNIQPLANCEAQTAAAGQRICQGKDMVIFICGHNDYMKHFITAAGLVKEQKQKSFLAKTTEFHHPLVVSVADTTPQQKGIVYLILPNYQHTRIHFSENEDYSSVPFAKQSLAFIQACTDSCHQVKAIVPCWCPDDVYMECGDRRGATEWARLRAQLDCILYNVTDYMPPLSQREKLHTHGNIWWLLHSNAGIGYWYDGQDKYLIRCLNKIKVFESPHGNGDISHFGVVINYAIRHRFLQQIKHTLGAWAQDTQGRNRYKTVTSTDLDASPRLDMVCSAREAYLADSKSYPKSLLDDNAKKKAFIQKIKKEYLQTIHPFFKKLNHSLSQLKPIPKEALRFDAYYISICVGADMNSHVIEHGTGWPTYLTLKKKVATPWTDYLRGNAKHDQYYLRQDLINNYEGKDGLDANPIDKEFLANYLVTDNKGRLVPPPLVSRDDRQAAQKIANHNKEMLHNAWDVTVLGSIQQHYQENKKKYPGLSIAFNDQKKARIKQMQQLFNLPKPKKPDHNVLFIKRSINFLQKQKSKLFTMLSILILVSAGIASVWLLYQAMQTRQLRARIATLHQASTQLDAPLAQSQKELNSYYTQLNEHAQPKGNAQQHEAIGRRLAQQQATIDQLAASYNEITTLLQQRRIMRFFLANQLKAIDMPLYEDTIHKLQKKHQEIGITSIQRKIDNFRKEGNHTPEPPSSFAPFL